MLTADPSDAGTFLDPDGDFAADAGDPGMFTITGGETLPGASVWVDGDAETTPGIERIWGWVTGVDLPLTAADGAMRVDVGVA